MADRPFDLFLWETFLTFLCKTDFRSYYDEMNHVWIVGDFSFPTWQEAARFFDEMKTQEYYHE